MTSVCNAMTEEPADSSNRLKEACWLDLPSKAVVLWHSSVDVVFMSRFIDSQARRQQEASNAFVRKVSLIIFPIDREADSRMYYDCWFQLYEYRHRQGTSCWWRRQEIAKGLGDSSLIPKRHLRGRTRYSELLYSCTSPMSLETSLKFQSTFQSTDDRLCTYTTRMRDFLGVDHMVVDSRGNYRTIVIGQWDKRSSRQKSVNAEVAENYRLPINTSFWYINTLHLIHISNHRLQPKKCQNLAVW